MMARRFSLVPFRDRSARSNAVTALVLTLAVLAVGGLGACAPAENGDSPQAAGAEATG